MTENDSLLAENILNAIASVAGPGPISLHDPYFKGKELDYLRNCIDSTFVSSVGQFVDRFESELAAYTGAKYAIAVASGTAALHAALLIAGVKGGDEVLVPSFTFIATANAVSYCGATSHFIDSEAITLGVDVAKLRCYLLRETEQFSGQCLNRKTKKIIRAIVPMHTFGHASDIDGLLRIAHDFNIILVEDAAESLGSFYNGKHLGTFGLLGALSFNGNKIITTGGGGAILTDNKNLALKAKHITNTARIAHLWDISHDLIGFNYRMPNLNAAIGCAQLEQIKSKIVLKKKIYGLYKVAFENVKGVNLYHQREFCNANYWLQTLLLSDENVSKKDSILALLNSAGYMSRPAWTLLSTLIPYADSPKMDLSGAELLFKKVINIPSNWCLNA